VLAAVVGGACVLLSEVGTPVTAQASAMPALPADTVDTTYTQPSNVVNVPSGSNLQTAINNASLGTTLMLQAGATYGAVTLPNKSGSGWIYIVSNGTLPALGNRVTPAQASQLAKIQVSTQPGISTSSGAHHYRFVGIEVSLTGTLTMAVVDLSSGGPSTQPHHIILDRCYIHGTSSGTHRRGVQLHGAHLAIINSHVSDFHEAGADSQAIVSWSGTGPLKIQNNFASAAGENILFGGADPTGSVGPSDIELRGNYLFKPTSWKGSSWTVKNLLEFKNSRRVLAEGNVLENNWEAAQNGFSILVTPRNQEGGCPSCGTQDITFRRNILINGQQGINILGDDNEQPSTRTARILFQDNRFGVCCVNGDSGRGFMTTRGPVDVVFDHNTWPTLGQQSFHENSPKAAGFVFTNNIIPNGSWGLIGTNSPTAAEVFAEQFANAVWTGNALVGSSSNGYPAGNFFPSSVAGATQTGIDGKPVGPDLALLNAATSCAVSGQCAGGGGGDTTPPTVSLTAPSASATLVGTVAVSADADDDTAVVGVQFRANGSNIGAEDTSAPYSISWNSASLADGAYTITAVARDAAGNSTTSAGVAVTVSNTGPVISGVSVSALTATSATVNWTTNQASDSQVDYGLTTLYGSSTALDTSLVTSHSQGITGLLPATLYHYRVRSQNSLGQERISADFVLNTVGAPIISGVGASATTATTATIVWTTNQASDSQIDYGLTTAYGSSTALNTAMVTSHSQTLTGLTSNQTYNYRVRSTNSFGLTTVSGNFTVVPVAPPVISGVGSSNITGNTATISWTTDLASDTQIEYGTTTSYGSSTALNTAMVTSHSQNVGGLSTGTLYHYRVKSRNAQGGLATSGDFTFTTASPAAISGISASAITGTTVTISWTTNQASDSQVDYGTTAAYGTSTPIDGAMVTSHSLGLSNLSPGTLYHYRVRSRNAAGLLATSGDQTFTTMSGPSISGVSAGSITGSSATINWSTNQASDTQVEYGPTTAYGSSTTLNTSMSTGHSQQISGLTMATLYHYRVKSKNALGLLSTSGDFTFSTKSPPNISNVKVSNKNHKRATITWDTSAASDSVVDFGTTTAYGSTSPVDGTMVVGHSRLIDDLAASTIYHYRVRSTDSMGLTGVSGDFTFTTDATPTQSFAVTVSTGGSTTGAVIAPVAGITCGSTCSGSVNSGTAVVFTAVPDPGSRFAGWGGACSGRTMACTVNVTGDTTVSASFEPAVTGDFDGDGAADLVWQHTDGTLALWTMQGSTQTSSNYITPLVTQQGIDWQIIGPGSGTGGEDPGTGGGTGPGGTGGFTFPTGGAGVSSAVYLTAQSRIVDLGWRIVGTPDLDGDGRADLLWQHTVTGKLAAWSMDGPVKTFAAFLTPDTMDPNSGWTIRATADFNGDRRADIVWQNTNGSLLVWLMNGRIKTGELTITPGSVNGQWRLSGSGDFDADGQADLVWQNQATGEMFLWLMNGTSMRQQLAIGQLAAGWQIRAVGDFDGDGRPDLISQKDTGELAGRFMNGTALKNASALLPGAVDPAWIIVGVK
jgi:hypothetical protein